MIKKITYVLFISTILMSCGGNGQKASSDESIQKESVDKEEVLVDSLSIFIEETKKDIESTSSELDELLDEL